jgi:UDP-N-acetylmuramyl pentapeptide phosphotransferase/UDP-N-acetylglucosamine-1-phosphate transferase
MNNYILLVFLSILLVALTPVFFSIARKYKMVDIPNERSSHSTITYRGAGILFVVAFLLYFLLFQSTSYYLLVGLILASVTGFLDDLYNLKTSTRVFLYGGSLLACLAQIPDFYEDVNIIVIVVAFVVGLGTVNAYNFMDGINGISVLYSAVLFSTLIYINEKILVNLPISQLDENMLYALLIGCIVFGFLNLRTKAMAFLGDVGSVFLGILAVYYVVYVCYATGDYSFTMLLLIYGVDSVLTIIHRIILKENIFDAHRKHLYQWLSNELATNHIWVASIYALLQLTINVFLIKLYVGNPILNIAILAIPTGIIYIILKLYLNRIISKKSLNNTKHV